MSDKCWQESCCISSGEGNEVPGRDTISPGLPSANFSLYSCAYVSHLKLICVCVCVYVFYHALPYSYVTGSLTEPEAPAILRFHPATSQSQSCRHV